MRIAVDLDGVCYHWERTARYMLRRWYKERGELHPAMLDRESKCWDDIMQNVSREAWSYLWSDAIAQGLFRHGHIVGGTIEALDALWRMGHDICIATARPVAAIGDTLAWCSLHFHRLPISDIRIHENKLETKADVYIDDAEHNVVAIAQAGKQAFLFDRPWNWGTLNGSRNITRVYGWEDAVRRVQEYNDLILNGGTD